MLNRVTGFHLSGPPQSLSVISRQVTLALESKSGSGNVNLRSIALAMGNMDNIGDSGHSRSYIALHSRLRTQGRHLRKTAVGLADHNRF